ncbi:COX15/CtaA family protein [Ramlibacter sp. AW1]|uniref:COX15/CtaA family protein n=1 Tax=Ramlibacter aurantiacus TaxID=2801330 RepID=A0A936ZKZ3_9BURK|nr:COX15/CtaA family protein [Ramlibacter aurantiacus]MBL0422128.1 COX15/CtaA family protein [Ramlibacter aurantiacus]
MADGVALYDLSPALHLMLLGVLIALAPLGWIWLRQQRAPMPQRLAALTVLTLFLTFDLVLFGAFTRLTDSGLGCPDWPGCYGAASPRGAHAQISQAQAAMPTGPVTHTKAWIEMVHRYLASGVGVLILVLAWVSWLRRRELPVHPLWPMVTLVWVCVQGAFGALTVTMKLQPIIVTLHLMGGLVLLALLCRQAMAYSHAHRGLAPLAISPGLRSMLAASFGLLWLQVALGGWVSTNYAVLACTTFPTCQGSWWPAMDFQAGFELWRELGRTGSGEHITFAALTAIHYVHRLVAYALLPLLVVLGWRLSHAGLSRPGRWMIVGAVWQLVTGLSNVVLGWPLVAAVAHTGGAAALVVIFTWAWYGSRAAQAVPRSQGVAAEVRP